MNEQLTSLAFSMEANKGVYALLLGSGISYSAGIPTGRGILREFCRRIMQMNGESESDPISWYEKKYGKPPLYNEVIALLAKTPSERQGLLKEFFEPTIEEAEQKQKIPTDAHHAIAKLVQRGYVKVIVTTNFDRLLEHSLDEHNVQYQTLYHDTDIEGMKPLAHAECTVLKVNGDYRDTRFKNVTDELDNFTVPLAQLLRRVFDEYGMIVSGWSAEWDTALRELIKSVKGRRYSWYWHAFAEPLTPYAEELISYRDASKIIDSKGADHFFTELYENVIHAAKIKRESMENTQVKMKRLQRYIQNERDIELREIVTEQTRSVVAHLSNRYYAQRAPVESIRTEVQVTAEKTWSLALSSALLAYYVKTTDQERLLLQTAERLTGSKHHIGDDYLLFIQDLPLHIVFYSIGVGAVMKGNYVLLNKLFTKPRVQDPHRQDISFLSYASSHPQLDILFKLVSEEKTDVASPEMLFTYPYVKKVFIETRLAFDEQEFKQYYDQFELLRAIKCHYLGEACDESGQFLCHTDYKHLLHFLNEGAETQGWPALTICDGSPQGFHHALTKLAKSLKNIDEAKRKELLKAYTVIQ